VLYQKCANVQINTNKTKYDTTCNVLYTDRFINTNLSKLPVLHKDRSTDKHIVYR